MRSAFFIHSLLLMVQTQCSNAGGNTISEQLMNERIRLPEVRVISQSGEQLGIMTSEEALGYGLIDRIIVHHA